MSGTTTTPSLKVVARQLEKLQSEIEQIKAEQNKQPLRHPPTGGMGGGGGKAHLAYCREAAPESDTISCYLDEDDPGSKIISVKCLLFSATKLSDCVPRLLTHKLIVVNKIGGTWYCFWFNNKIICDRPT